jgi:DNA polymerase I-like protein with 3'-5' exonuclease and polymerase domains
MAAVYDVLPPEAKMMATVHDEILVEAPADLAADPAAAVKVDVVDTWGGNL